MNKPIAVILILVGIVVAFCVTDCSSGTARHFECNISAHQFIAAWDETTFSTDSDGNVEVSTTHHPEEYHVICAESAGSSKVFDVSTIRAQYYTVMDGQAVTVKTRIGKWTGVCWLPRIEE